MAALCADDQSLDAIAQDCGVSPADLKTFYDAFAATEKVVSLFSQGSNQSVQGVHKGLSLINAHLLSGKIGKPGAAPFSITGQPNAMGGREVGGLANMLAAHMDFDEASRSRVRRYWDAPTMAPKPGLKAVDMFEAVRAGKIKAIWIMATNPMVSMPDTNKIHEALSLCEMVVVSDVIARTDTMDMAHIQLPAAAWGEKDGTVTNSERVISRQRRMVALPGSVRPDWAIVAEVARRMNSAWDTAFAWKGPHEVFAEHAGLTAFENDGSRFLDLSGFVGQTRDAYNALAPTRWPYTLNGSSNRLFTNGRFATPDGRARLVAPKATGPAQATTPDLPFSLNSVRVRDHWHTMTRTALAPELNRHITEPLLDIHPRDARRLGVKDGRLAVVTTAYGEAILKAKVTDDVREGNLSVPMHWTRQFAPFGRANPLVSPAVDPISGQPEFKHTPARVAAYGEAWHGFVATPRNFDGELPAWRGDTIWRRTAHAFADCFEIAGIDPLDVSRIPVSLTLDDVTTGLTRRVGIDDGRLTRVIFIAPIHKKLPPRDWLLERFGDDTPRRQGSRRLADRPPPRRRRQGPHHLRLPQRRRKDHRRRRYADGAASVEGHCAHEATSAGTACGSCKGELKQCLLAHTKEETKHAA